MKLNPKTVSSRLSKCLDRLEAVTRSLSGLYVKLETGAITEEEFAAEEKQLLDRLDEIERRNQSDNEQADDESGDESDEGEDASHDEPDH